MTSHAGLWRSSRQVANGASRRGHGSGCRRGCVIAEAAATGRSERCRGHELFSDPSVLQIRADPVCNCGRRLTFTSRISQQRAVSIELQHAHQHSCARPWPQYTSELKSHDFD